jgi:hypothetical protein
MGIRNQFSAFLLLSMLPTAVKACSCVVGSMGFCQALPDAGNADRAVFLGRVTEFYPKSRGELNPILEEFARTHRDLQEALHTQSPNTTDRHVAGGSPGNLDWRKNMTEYIWGDKLGCVANLEWND